MLLRRHCLTDIVQLDGQRLNLAKVLNLCFERLPVADLK